MAKLSWKFFYLATALSLFLSPLLTAQSGTPATPPCVLGYTVGFFNGVWNTHPQAVDSLNALHNAVQEASGSSTDVYNQEDVRYITLYNHTGSGTVAGHSLQDIAETFEQRANDLDSTGKLAADALYMFWEVIGAATQFHEPLAAASPDYSAFYEKFIGDAAATAAAAVSTVLSSPPTAADYADQQAMLTTEANAGRKLLLIAHSQGNLFAKVGYDFIQPVVTTARVSAVHIAPASPPQDLRGPWILSTNDQVIKYLRIDGGTNSVPATTITIPLSPFDKSGHELIPSYLDADPTRKVEALMLDGLSKLTSTSLCDATVSPSTMTTRPGGTVSLTATVSPAVTDTALTTFYRWTTSGSAGGTFTGGGAGSGTSFYTSSTPDVTYTASGSAAQGTSDTVTVSIIIATNPYDLTTAKEIGSGTAVLNVQAGVTNVTYTYTGYPYVPSYCTPIFHGADDCLPGYTTGTITFSIPQGYTGYADSSAIVSGSFTAHGVTQTLNFPSRTNDDAFGIYLTYPFYFKDGVITTWLFSIYDGLLTGPDAGYNEDEIDIADTKTASIAGITCGGQPCAELITHLKKPPTGFDRAASGTAGTWSVGK